MPIKENIEKLNIPSNIILVAATKTRTTAEISEAIQAGITIIGENYVQEAESKHKELKDKVKIHCIGHLQTNKVKKAVELFDLIETVDSVKIAKEINKRTKKTMPILIEINSGEEESKTGVNPEQAIDLIKNISTLENIKIKLQQTLILT